MRLTADTLAALPPSLAPRYDRGAVRVGIVHVGVGGFHRAHEAVYVDRLMSQGLAGDWGICGVGLLAADRRMQQVLRAQDCLYTVVCRHADGHLEPHVVGSLVRYLFAPDDPDAAIEAMASPDVRIVSLTITEGGYNLHPVTGKFDAGNSAVVADLRSGAAPATVFGLVTEALARRRRRGTAPFTVCSCDNLEGNGDLARRAFSAFARLRDPEFGSWVAAEVAFPNSMVDRITPVTTAADQALLAERFGISDGWPVVCEPFLQWVLEDRFPAGRPPLERAGVTLTDDVRPYELMKLRLLNAGHQAVGYLGRLCGYRYVHEAAADPLIVGFLRGYLEHEATPTLAPVPGVDLAGYRTMVVDRFANPQMRDTLARICEQSSDRIPKFLLPVVRRQLSTGGEMFRSALVVAAWARCAEGRDEQGRPIEIVDVRREQLVETAAQHGNPVAFIEDRELFGDLADDPRFTEAYVTALHSLQARGVRATLEMLST